MHLILTTYACPSEHDWAVVWTRGSHDQSPRDWWPARRAAEIADGSWMCANTSRLKLTESERESAKQTRRLCGGNRSPTSRTCETADFLVALNARVTRPFSQQVADLLVVSRDQGGRGEGCKAGESGATGGEAPERRLRVGRGKRRSQGTQWTRVRA